MYHLLHNIYGMHFAEEVDRVSRSVVDDPTNSPFPDYLGDGSASLSSLLESDSSQTTSSYSQASSSSDTDQDLPEYHSPSARLLTYRLVGDNIDKIYMYKK